MRLSGRLEEIKYLNNILLDLICVQKNVIFDKTWSLLDNDTG